LFKNAYNTLNFICSDTEICSLNCQISPSTSTALRQWETRVSIPFFYHSEFFTRSHFFTSSLTSSFLLNAFPEMASLRAPKRRKPWGEGYGLRGGWGRRVNPIFYCSQFFSKLYGSASSCWRRRSAVLVRTKFPKSLLHGFNCLRL